MTYGTSYYGPIEQRDKGNVLEDVSLDSDKTTEPFLISGYKTVTLLCDYVHNSATKITMTIEVNCYKGDTEWYVLQDIDFNNIPNIASEDAVFSKDVTADAKFSWIIPIRGGEAKLTFSSVEGGANDKITVRALVSAE